MWCVYIILCADNSLYCGATNDVEARFKAHSLGKGGAYTRSHKPVKLLYTEKLDTKSQALKREIEIKSWSREAKIKRLELNLEK